MSSGEAEAIVRRDLYGGAVQLAMPQRFADICDFRPVPDHQEVFTDAESDQSITTEILERHSVPDDQAATFYLNDQAEQNSSPCQVLEVLQSLGVLDVAKLSTHSCRSDAERIISESAGDLHVPGSPPGTFVGHASGMQSVSKGRQGAEAANQVLVQVAVVRLEQAATDFLVVLNTPVCIHERSAAAEHAGTGHKQRHTEAPELFRAVLQSLIIRDMGLFGSGS